MTSDVPKPDSQPETLRSKVSLSRKHIWFITGPAGCGKTTVAENLSRNLKLQCVEGDDFHTDEAVHKMKVLHQPLTDADRWDWLIRIREHALDICRGLDPIAPKPANPLPPTLSRPPAPPRPPPSHVAEPIQPEPHERPTQPTSGPTEACSVTTAPQPPDFKTSAGAVVTCSALKSKYRDEFRIASLPTHTARRFRLSVYFIYLSLDEAELRRRVAARKNHYMTEAMVASQLASLERPSEVEIGEDVVLVDARGDEGEVMRLVMDGVRAKLEKE